MSEELLAKALETQKGRDTLALAMANPMRNLKIDASVFKPANIRKSVEECIAIINKRLANESNMSEEDKKICLTLKEKGESYLRSK